MPLPQQVVACAYYAIPTNPGGLLWTSLGQLDFRWGSSCYTSGLAGWIHKEVCRPWNDGLSKCDGGFFSLPVCVCVSVWERYKYTKPNIQHAIRRQLDGACLRVGGDFRVPLLGELEPVLMLLNWQFGVCSSYLNASEGQLILDHVILWHLLIRNIPFCLKVKAFFWSLTIFVKVSQWFAVLLLRRSPNSEK